MGDVPRDYCNLEAGDTARIAEVTIEGACRSPLSVAEPSGTTPSLWERRSGRRLSHEDDREIRENLSGFFRVLTDWDRELRGDR